MMSNAPHHDALLDRRRIERTESAVARIGGETRIRSAVFNSNERKMKQSFVADGSKRELGLDPVVALSLAGALVFFLISGAVAYFNLRTLRDNNQKIVHSQEVIMALDELLF